MVLAVLAVASGCVAGGDNSSPAGTGSSAEPSTVPAVEQTMVEAEQDPAVRLPSGDELPSGYELVSATTASPNADGGPIALRRVAAVGRTGADPRLIEYTLFEFEDQESAGAAAALPNPVELADPLALDRGGVLGFVGPSGQPTDDLRAQLQLVPYGPGFDAVFQVPVTPTVLAVGGSAVVQPATLAPILDSLSTEAEPFESNLPDGMAILVDEAPLDGITFELRSSTGAPTVELYSGASRAWFEYFSWGIVADPAASELVAPGTDISVRPSQYYGAGGAATDPERTMVWNEERFAIVTHAATMPSTDLAELLAFFLGLDDDEALELATSVGSEAAQGSDEQNVEAQPGQGPVSDVPSVDDMARMQEFVELARGIEAAQPIAFDFVDDFPTSEARGAQFLSAELWVLAVALGLTEDGQTLEGANQARIDRIKGTPGVVELQPTRTFTDVVVVHEMVHVIDPAPRVVADPELLSLGQAVAEGNAHRIAFDYLMTLPEDRQTLVPDFPAIFAPEGDQRISTAVQDLLEFPYDEGRIFMAEIAERGGEDLVEAVMRRPPVSTEQLLFVDAWEADDAPAVVERPAIPAGASSVVDGTLGVFLLFLAAREAGLGQQALAVLDQWAGDAFSAYQEEGRTCVVARIEMDTSGAAAALADLLDEAGGQRSSADGRGVDAVFCS